MTDEEARQDALRGITPAMRERAGKTADPFQSLVDQLAAVMAPVWIVIRDADGDIEVDVFATEEAAREHARILAEHWGADQGETIVREETVATSAWAGEVVE